ncbi:MAG: UDP-N-acetylmuramoyl-tripeptide--D-alanyl-D-alanine ligase [Candidatus Rokubacteria bacterium]|nr:UDP-N-acetylmuramoyl-tripeptide--D-alanyl-D-alanine ligase [Candidatus Rokubacteria bacterium]
MPIFTVRDIVRATHGALVTGDLAVPVTGVTIDSRAVGVGEAFFAIRGHRTDGHAFLADAAGRGASCLVVHTLPDDAPANVPVVLVEDTTKALGRLAAAHRAQFSIPVVAITGSNGKTTAKELAASVLGVRWRTLKSPASFNNQWGLPLTLLRLAPEHEVLVAEIGTNQPGEIAYLAGIAQPTVAVVTTIAAVHTEFLGSLDGVREEKAALVRAVPPEGHVVLNADDPRVAGMARETRARVLTYGRHATAHVRAVDDPVEDGRGLGFTLEAAGHRERVTIAFAGRHNLTNALAAAATGLALGLEPAEIAGGLELARPVAGRCVWREAGGVRMLDDTYNANPVSMRAALETVAARRGPGRLVVVLGDMLELGALTEEAHRALGRQVAALRADEFVGLGRHAQLAVEAAREAGLAEVHPTMTLEDTVGHLHKRLEAGDTVLVKGSRGMRMERVVDALVARLARVDTDSERA